MICFLAVKNFSLKHKGKSSLFFGCILVIVTGCFPSQQSLLSQYPSPRIHISGTLATIGADTSVTIQQKGITIPADFIGFSYELSQTCEIVRLDKQNPEYYEQLYENLGIGVLEIGGHTGDYSEWVPDGISSCSTVHTVVTKTLIDSIFVFAHRIHWKVFWGLNLIANDPQSAANEAAYVAAAGKSELIGFKIGNEPELYVQFGARLSGWGYINFLEEWEQYKNAVLSAVPSAEFIGPEACCETPFFTNFLVDEGKSIIIATHHYYNGNASTTSFTPSYLLSKQVMHLFVAQATKWMAFALDQRLPLEISETNTFSGGGAPGVSNSFAATLWASDYLFKAAELGIRRVDFQSSLMAIYDAIDNNGMPKALYYGLLFFHIVTEGARIVQTTIQTFHNITAYAVIGSNGSLNVVILNKDTSHKYLVAININHLYHSAKVIRLVAPNIASTAAITVGGRAISAKGTWTSSSSEVLTIHGTVVNVQIPPASAASLVFLE